MLCITENDLVKTTDNLTKSQKDIVRVCTDIANMLISKNKKYGDSALTPVRIFSKANNVEQLKVRLDDKINRIMNQDPDDTEDTILDLVGYLILYMIAKERVSDGNE